MEQGVTTTWGYEREMEVDEPALAHAGCFIKATRRYRRDKVEGPGGDHSRPR
jgi:hypothetical protein